ncbi:MAG: hypothetical protein VB035_07160 [Candidatus Fimivivens sp.]|nr:hypothetical protein [Candidatus Fimivivens sp.]
MYYYFIALRIEKQYNARLLRKPAFGQSEMLYPNAGQLVKSAYYTR